MLKIFQRPLVQPTYNTGPYLCSATRHKQFFKWMSPKFNSERVLCPDKYFFTVCFSFQGESSRFSKQQNKLVLTLNSFRNGALFGISLEVLEEVLEVIEALSSPLAKCRESRAQSFLGEKISPSNGTCSLDCVRGVTFGFDFSPELVENTCLLLLV